MTITELQKRGGLSDEAYANVSKKLKKKMDVLEIRKLYYLFFLRSSFREVKKPTPLVDQEVNHIMHKIFCNIDFTKYFL